MIFSPTARAPNGRRGVRTSSAVASVVRSGSPASGWPQQADFFSYEGIRIAQSAARFATVPTQAMRADDLNELPGRQVTVYDPFALGQGLGVAVLHTLFPGNRNPAERPKISSQGTCSTMCRCPTGAVPGRSKTTTSTTRAATTCHGSCPGRLDLYASVSSRMFVSVDHQGTNILSDDLLMTLADHHSFPN